MATFSRIKGPSALIVVMVAVFAWIAIPTVIVMNLKSSIEAEGELKQGRDEILRDVARRLDDLPERDDRLLRMIRRVTSRADAAFQGQLKQHELAESWWALRDYRGLDSRKLSSTRTELQLTSYNDALVSEANAWIADQDETITRMELNLRRIERALP